MAKQYFYGLSITILAALLFSIKAIFIKFAYQYGASVTVVMTLRVLFSLPIYLWTFYSLKQSQASIKANSYKQLFAIAALGITGYYIAAYLDLMGLKYISANLERLIIYLYPTFVLVLSVIFFSKQITLSALACILLSYTGVAIVFLQDFSLASGESTSKNGTIDGIILLAGLEISTITWGAFITLLSALCFAIYIAFSHSIIQQVGSAYFTVIAMSFASLAILLHASINLDLSHLTNQHMMVYLMSACAAILSTVLPSFLLAEGIKQIGASDASMASAVGPFGTLIVAGIFLGETVSLHHIIGLLLVVFGIVLMAKQSNKNTQNN